MQPYSHCINMCMPVNCMYMDQHHSFVLLGGGGAFRDVVGRSCSLYGFFFYQRFNVVVVIGGIVIICNIFHQCCMYIGPRVWRVAPVHPLSPQFLPWNPLLSPYPPAHPLDNLCCTLAVKQCWGSPSA